jgi:hypothetical protein
MPPATAPASPQRPSEQDEYRSTATAGPAYSSTASQSHADPVAEAVASQEAGVLATRQEAPRSAARAAPGSAAEGAAGAARGVSPPAVLAQPLPAGVEAGNVPAVTGPHAGEGVARAEVEPDPLAQRENTFAAVEGPSVVESPHAEELGQLTPQTARLLAGALPVDLAALARRVDRFFARVERLGEGMNAWDLVERLTPWLGAVAAGTAAYDLTRRRKAAASAVGRAEGSSSGSGWPLDRPLPRPVGEP